MHRLSKFFKLSPGDQALLAEALITVVAVRAALWIVPFRFLRPRLERQVNSPRHLASQSDVQRISWAVSKVSGVVPRATCLTQAMSVRWLLAQRRIGCTLRLGVKRDPAGVFCAHAWVEYADRVVIGGQPDLTEFAPLAAL